MTAERSPRQRARLPRGLRDRTPADILAERGMIETIRKVYECYGFEPLETPAFEYTEALGKFLPDLDRPNEGVFSLKDDDGQWLSLRYDLTAPLARYVAENFQQLPKPFRRYQFGQVWRNEKPGPGRYREFTQFDADTVGTGAPAADAELLMMVCDALEALGLGPGEYVVKFNSRKLLDEVLNHAEVDPSKRATVLRAIDKFDRLGIEGVRALLGKGRKDSSGDVTLGAELQLSQIEHVLAFISGVLPAGMESVGDLAAIRNIVQANGYGEDRIVADTSIIRGLAYYTGPVFEAQLRFPVTNEAGEEIVFGSVAGGGRYDNLVSRFTGQQVPATGISIGVSRLLSAVRDRKHSALAPLVLVLTIEDVTRSFAMARELREAGLRAEAYVGTKRVGDQLRYADKRGAAVTVLEGADELAAGNITLKDMKRGVELSRTIESRAEWLGGRQAQVTVPRDCLVQELKKLLTTQGR